LKRARPFTLHRNEWGSSMIDIQIPGFKHVAVEYLTLDFNGTIACDGVISEGTLQLLTVLSRNVEIHILTADTHGNAASACQDLPCRLVVLPEGDQDVAKRDYVRKLGADRTVCIGNGRNDRLMVGEAAVGIAIIGEEGAATETIRNADVVCRSASEALSLLVNPRRLVATLRS
jgi:soluble P-type ATPase